MALTELQIKSAKAKEKRYMILDSDGLYLDITPSGVKSWRYRYARGDKEHKATLGRYPLVSLKDARAKRDDMKRQLMDGADPSLVKKRSKGTAGAITFGEVYQEWFENKVLPVRSAERIEHVKSWGRLYLIPDLGNLPIADVDAMVLLAMLRKPEAKGTVYTAHVLRNVCSQIFRYAIATGRASRDPAADLRGALRPYKEKHRAALTEVNDIKNLLLAIDGYSGFVVRCAMQIQALTFVRPGELRHMEWTEIDEAAAEWRIPPGKMKMARPHIVPLARQALEILRALRPVTGHGRFVFPSNRTPNGSRPISEAAVLVAIRTMGFGKDEMSWHGFRGMASTQLYESGLWLGDAIERQLAHAEGNSVKAAYNYADHLPVRREMMQWWADWLDRVRGS